MYLKTKNSLHATRISSFEYVYIVFFEKTDARIHIQRYYPYLITGFEAGSKIRQIIKLCFLVLKSISDMITESYYQNRCWLTRLIQICRLKCDGSETLLWRERIHCLLGSWSYKLWTMWCWHPETSSRLNCTSLSIQN